jgi:hypothetical protein
LLNDRTGKYWNVWVDKKPTDVLRCNYIMRGVFLTPGQHTIRFHFEAPLQWLYVSIATCALGIILAGYVIFARCSGRSNAKTQEDGKDASSKE